MKDSNLTPNLS